MEGLITPPKSLFVYNVWVVLAGRKNTVKERLLGADQCLANVVGNAKEAKAWLAESLKRLLLTGSPNEHVLQVNYDKKGLLDGTA